MATKNLLEKEDIVKGWIEIATSDESHLGGGCVEVQIEETE